MRQIHGAKEYFFLDEEECSKNIIKESEKKVIYGPRSNSHFTEMYHYQKERLRAA